MNKKVKHLIIIIAVLIGMLMLPTTINAAVVDKSNETLKLNDKGGTIEVNKLVWDDEKDTGLLGEEVKLDNKVFENNFIFCYQAAQVAFPDKNKEEYEYTVARRYMINNTVLSIDYLEGDKPKDFYPQTYFYKFVQGLAHILSYTDSEEVYQNRKFYCEDGGKCKVEGCPHFYYTSARNDVQLALWEYLTVCSESHTFPDLFGVSGAGRQSIWYTEFNEKRTHTLYEPNHKECWLGGVNSELGYKTSEWRIYIKNEDISEEIEGENLQRKKAYEIYKEAEAIRNGGRPSSITAEIYVLESSDPSQSLLLVKKVDAEPSINLTFYKEDQNGNGVSGANISFTNIDNVDWISCPSLTSAGEDGAFGGTFTVIPKENTGTFTLRVTETAPEDYTGIGYVDLTVKYDETTGEVTGITHENPVNVKIDFYDKSKVTIKNELKTKIEISKTDEDTGTIFTGDNPAIFNMTIKGANSVKVRGDITSFPKGGDLNSGDYYDGIIKVENISLGTIWFEEIGHNGDDYYVTIELTEITAPEGYSIENPTTTIEIPELGRGYPVVIRDNNNDSYENYDYGTKTISINIPNTSENITISGNVWEDGQIGEKGNVNEPNGIKDPSEKNLQGITVNLYSAKLGGPILYSTITDANGNYSFTDIPRIEEGYRVQFIYDGVNYMETPRGTVSKASEAKLARENFNKKFQIISAGKAQDVDGNYIELNYTYNSSNKKSVLNTNNPEFKIPAIAEGPYKGTATDVNCGLVKRNFDLSLGTDVKEVALKINEKETKYSYAQIMNGVLDFQNSSSTANDVIYNLNLYSSDYNYRISDYKTDVVGNNSPDNDNNNIADYENIQDLEAYVTYSVILKAQVATSYAVNVKEFVYYYDEAYEPYNIPPSSHNYTVSIDTDARKITFRTKSNFTGLSLNRDNDYRLEIDLTFKIRKDENGNLIVNKTATNIAEITEYYTYEGFIDKDSAPGNGITNGKITQYEDDTDEAKGLNINLRLNETRTINGTVFEDTKTGEKPEYNGQKDDSEQGVNDVIVQLIEIKKIGGKYYEYIWQETRSGSNQVKTTAKNGYEGTTYRYLKKTEDKAEGTREYVIEDGEKILNIYVKEQELNANGEYKFVDFIPGNYIIRYIYGDGRTYDVTDNVKTYNGQNYKSTTDPNYQQPWYNTSTYDVGSSVARDNEARRLEVMAFSTVIDATMGQVLNILNEDISVLSNSQKEVLDNYYESLDKNDVELKEALDALNRFKTPEDPTITFDNINDADKKEYKYKLIQYYVSNKTWMCAETSKINIPVDADNKSTEADSVAASYNYTYGNTKVQFGDMNFGLALRPNANIVLEKHITALKITPSGTGVQSIVDARAESIEAIVNGNDVKVKGVTQGLAPVKSTADNRGFWQVATDIEELMQGAELEVEYTYVLKNDSQEDYLTSFLTEQYKNGIDNGSYVELLKTKAAEVKEATKGQTQNYGSYLGQFYYTGTKGENDSIVPARVEIIEEALNNTFTLDETETAYFKAKEPEANKKYYVYGVNKAEGIKETQVDTIIQNTKASNFITPKLQENHTSETADWTRTIKLRTTLATVTGGELGANLPSYIAEIVQYSNAAGRKDMTSTAANLSYIHSDDSDMTIAKDNEQDEFWAETIIITKPTGENKLMPLYIAIIAISSITILGVGIVLIKKYVLNK